MGELIQSDLVAVAALGAGIYATMQGALLLLAGLWRRRRERINAPDALDLAATRRELAEETLKRAEKEAETESWVNHVVGVMNANTAKIGARCKELDTRIDDLRSSMITLYQRPVSAAPATLAALPESAPCVSRKDKTRGASAFVGWHANQAPCCNRAHVDVSYYKAIDGRIRKRAATKCPKHHDTTTDVELPSVPDAGSEDTDEEMTSYHWNLFRPDGRLFR